MGRDLCYQWQITLYSAYAGGDIGAAKWESSALTARICRLLVALRTHSTEVIGCVVALPGFAAKVVGVIDSVSTGSGSDRIKVCPQRKMRSLSFKETSGSRRYRSGY